MKASISDLVMFGGRLEFEQPVHVGPPNTGVRNLLFEFADDLLDRRWLTNSGPLEQERIPIEIMVNDVNAEIDRALTNRYSHETKYSAAELRLRWD